jgi:hypothetical protein
VPFLNSQKEAAVTPLLARLAAIVQPNAVESRQQVTADDAIFSTMIVEQMNSKTLGQTLITMTRRETTDDN